jgi:hypothetical protein
MKAEPTWKPDDDEKDVPEKPPHGKVIPAGSSSATHEPPKPVEGNSARQGEERPQRSE